MQNLIWLKSREREPSRPNLDIILRTCDREFRSVSRWTGNKQQTVIGCLNSLVQSVQYAYHNGWKNINLTWVDDHSSAQLVAMMTKILLNHWPGSVKRIISDGSGNGHTLGLCLDYGRNHCRDLVFLLEDDYIQQESAIYEMLESDMKLREDLEQDIVLFPVDYKDRYIPKFFYHGLGHDSQVYLGSHRHWHTIPSTTCTFWMHSRTLNQYFDIISPLRQYGIDHSITELNTINKVFEHVPCLSPLPGIAEHVMDQPTEIFVDWRQRWNQVNDSNMWLV